MKSHLKFTKLIKSNAEDIVNKFNESIDKSLQAFGKETIISGVLRYQLSSLTPCVEDDLGGIVTIDTFCGPTEDGIIFMSTNGNTSLIGKTQADEGLVLLKNFDCSDFISKFLKAVFRFQTIYFAGD